MATLAVLADLPVVGVVVEMAAMFALACGTALTVRRTSDVCEPSAVVSVGVLVAAVAAVTLPPRLALLVGPGPLWRDAHERWVILLAIGVILLAYGLRDPAARAPWRRVRPSRGGR